MKTNNSIHTPVLLKELLSNLAVKANGSYVDCTAGFGGHSGAIVNKLTTGHLTCIDQDVNAINYLKKLFMDKKNVTVVHDNFANIDKIINHKVDGIIMDLGVSSLMFDDPNRGFSYKKQGPLDMRMNPQDSLTAAYIVNNYARAQLIKIFKQYADIRNPNKVVDAIISYREINPIKTTTQLSQIICDCFPGSLIRKHPAKVYFQALRMEVNNELEVLTKALNKACELLKPQARLCVITFHSLEDRIVKNTFRQLTEVKDLYAKGVPISKLTKPRFKLITKKPVIPSQQEININKRSHSAKLRVIERI